MSIVKKIATLALAASVLTACSQNGGADGKIRKQDAGALFGAVGGALAGSTLGKGKGNVAAIAVGTLAGAYLGSEIGKSMDKADIAYMNRTTQRTLESTKTNTTSTWTNPDSGVSGTVTPTKTFQTASGQNCREYTQTVNIGGKQETAYGKACRTADGSWKIQ